MANELKAGDVVQLKSGGPKMTVTGVGDRYGTLTASCTWFVDTKLEHGNFPVNSLQHAAV